MQPVTFIKDKKIGSLTVHAVPRESYGMRGSVTSYPVEDGGSTQDHLQIDNESISLTCMVSNTPVKENQTGMQGKQVYEELKKMWKAREPITIVTGLDTKEDVAIENVNIDRDVNTGQGLYFSVDLVKVNIVTTKTVENINKNIGGDKETKKQTEKKATQEKTSTSPHPSSTQTVEESLKKDYHPANETSWLY